MFLSVVSVAASCNTNDVDSVVPAEGVKMTLAVATAPATKVDVAESGDAWSVKWSNGDALAAWSGANVEKFTMKSWGAESSTFEGTAPAESGTMRLVYPYTESLTLSLANQDVMSGFDHLGTTTYMVSDAIDVSNAPAAVSMTHVGAAIELCMKFDDSVVASDYTLKTITIGVDGGVEMPLKGLLDIQSGELEVKQSGSMTIDADAIAANDGIYYARFSTFPFEIEAGGELKIVATFTNGSDEYIAQGSVVNNTGATASIARATKNTLYSVLSTPSKNLVMNSDFEDGFDNWTSGTAVGGASNNTPQVVDNTNVLSGIKSLFMNHADVQWGNGVITQLVSVEAGKTYSYGYTSLVVDESSYGDAVANMNIQYFKTATTAGNIKNDTTAEVLTNSVRGRVKALNSGEVTITDANVKFSPNGDQVIIFIQKNKGTTYHDNIWFVEKLD